MGDSLKPEVRIHADLAGLSRAAAEAVAEVARRAAARRGWFSLVLAGGSTPRTLYELLAREYRDAIPWADAHLFFGDERHVPPDHPDSNYGMAAAALISHVPIPPGAVRRIRGEAVPSEEAAVYERALREFFGMNGRPTAPTFDLVLLGVGEDGHTASLFPGDPVLAEREAWVRAVVGPPSRPPRDRVTLTLPAINQARAVFFLSAGTGKREVVRPILEHAAAAAGFPAAMVRAQEQLLWFLDRAAAGP